ncbi:MAG: L,D-transpeptidase [Actinomycetota bacterium]|nr:L,D-transpeptidase [Actinomycetota bacterium]
MAKSRRRVLSLSGVVALLAAGNLAALASGRLDAPVPVPVPVVTVAVMGTPPTLAAPAPPPRPPPFQAPVSTMLAAPRGTISTYAQPGGPQSGTVGSFYGYALVLPVVDEQPGWLEVRLPQRPNESLTWVHADAVSVSSTGYFVLVDLGTEHLTVYLAGQAVMSVPVGTGVAATPTVTGNYFVAVHEPHADPLLGPVVLDLSAHSDAIQSWEGSGDAIIAIHGPVDSSADSRIGTTGARVSNGCIRLHTADQLHLAPIPAGAPVDIIS